MRGTPPPNIFTKEGMSALTLHHLMPCPSHKRGGSVSFICWLRLSPYFTVAGCLDLVLPCLPCCWIAHTFVSMSAPFFYFLGPPCRTARLSAPYVHLYLGLH